MGENFICISVCRVLFSAGERKPQGQLHQINVMHYVPLWILNNYRLFSGVVLALIKHCSVIYRVFIVLFFFWFFPQGVCFSFSHFATLKGKFAVLLYDLWLTAFFCAFKKREVQAVQVWSVQLLTVKTRRNNEVHIHLYQIVKSSDQHEANISVCLMGVCGFIYRWTWHV